MEIKLKISVIDHPRGIFMRKSKMFQVLKIGLQNVLSFRTFSTYYKKNVHHAVRQF